MCAKPPWPGEAGCLGLASLKSDCANSCCIPKRRLMLFCWSTERVFVEERKFQRVDELFVSPQPRRPPLPFKLHFQDIGSHHLSVSFLINVEYIHQCDLLLWPSALQNEVLDACRGRCDANTKVASGVIAHDCLWRYHGVTLNMDPHHLATTQRARKLALRLRLAMTMEANFGDINLACET